jgi:hypothetical protein
MQAERAMIVEKNVDRAASALFAMAAAYAAHAWFAVNAVQQVAVGETAAIAFVAYLVCAHCLGAVKPEARKLPVPIFDVRNIDPVEPSELLLTDRVEPQPAAPDMALVLDDILAKLGPDARVVRLFDPKSMPTAGELKSRIDRHLDSEAAAAQSFDAAQALHEALAELRRSIR